MTSKSTDIKGIKNTLRGAMYDYNNELYSEIDLSCLTNQGLEVGRELSCGDFGCTYKVCKLGDCSMVIKIGDISSQEVEMLKYSSAKGIGPKFYGYLECPTVNLKSKVEKDKMGVIIMEQLDLNVAELIPWHITKKSLIILQNLAKKILKARLHHGDLHLGNLMAILDNEENIIDWKLIDYGFASIIPDLRKDSNSPNFDLRSDQMGNFLRYEKNPDEALEPIIAEWMCLFDQLIYEIVESGLSEEDFMIELVGSVEEIKKKTETELMAIANVDDYSPLCKFYDPDY
jgi:hypothetical protein